jgi:hypothetical protein
MAIRISGTQGKDTGVKLGDYGNIQDGNGVIGWIEPACENPQWILWFEENGDALLYTEREENGGVMGEPIKISARNKTPIKA